MASGRIIQNKICRSKTVHDLSTDLSRLGFTWFITHADRDGRVPADPAVVKSLIFPRRIDISIEAMEAMLKEWDDAGLIVLYAADGDRFAYFPEFRKNQPKMRYEKEAESTIPVPPPQGTDQVRTYSAPTPEQGRSEDGATPPEEKRREEKRREGGARRRLEDFQDPEDLAPGVASGRSPP